MADPKGINTGTGGFPIDGDRYSYDTGEENEEFWRQRVPWTAGDINVDDAPKDISPTIKRTLASYLSKTTAGNTPSAPSAVANAYPIRQSPDEDPTTLKLSTADGYARSPEKVSESQPKFENNIVPGDSRSKALPNFIRGREKPSQAIFGDFSQNVLSKKNGNNLLKDLFPNEPKTAAIASRAGFNPPLSSKDISASDPENPINDYYGKYPNSSGRRGATDAAGLSNSMIYNRFNPNVKYTDALIPGVDPNYSISQNNNDKEVHLSREQYQKPREYQPGRSAPLETRGVSYGVLAQVGPMLSMRSSAELGSFADGVVPDVVASVGTFLPGSAQLGLDKIQREQLTAGDVIKNLSNTPIATTNLINPMDSSWGNLNNVNEEFSGITDVGMQLLAAALVVTVNISFAALGKIIGSSSAQPFTSKNEITGKYFSGRSRQRVLGPGEYSDASPDVSSAGIVGSLLTGGLNFYELLGIQSTERKFEDCLYVGLLQSFGVDSKEIITDGGGTNVTLGLASKIASTVSKSPGYYAILARAVNRSILTIGDSFVKFAKAFTQIFTNPVAAAKLIFDIINTLKNSKFLKIANVFAKLGDDAIRLELDKRTKEQNVLRVSAGGAQTLADRGILEPNQSPYQTRSWATHRASDFLLAPSSLSAIDPNTKRDLGVPSMATSARSIKNSSIYVSSVEGRISTEDREKYEDSLESEYVPFYMQDVRTNEILSFHAFLNSLSDSYSSTYDSVDGMGRVEPIKMYKSTSRKIDFSFWLVSTSHQDFDSMWLKINKLTTMVYPQYSKGRKISTNDGKYSVYAPFSQLIQAAPLLRVRIGDLIKSNYSKFNLSRLFGYNYKDTVFNDQSHPSSSNKLDNAIEKIKKQYLDNPPINTTWFPTELKYSWFQTKSTISGADLALSDIINKGVLPPRKYCLKVISTESRQKTVLCQFVSATKDDLLGVIDREDPKKYFETFETDLIGRKIVMPIRSLEITESTNDKIYNEAKARENQTSKYNEEASNFMSSEEDGNVVSRSFRSAGGKGLAGVVESLTFEWPTDKQWEIGQGEISGPQGGKNYLGRRAPMMCKVNVGFSPMHDITPGLDHLGQNRAPIYPVGPMSFNDMYSLTKKVK